VSRPRVLVPLQFFQLHPASELRVASARDTYLRKFEQYQLQPLFVSAISGDDVLDQLYSQADGVFLMGGSDVDPVNYGQKPHPETEITEADRDGLELKIIKRVLAAKDKPLLGICRGCQMLNVASGGTLIQHVADRYPTESHSLEDYYQLLTAPKHPLIVDISSKLFDILGSERGEVNSSHHQAVDKTGPDFRVSARSPAGVPEAIEHLDPNYFCLGIQSHPEAEENGFLEPVFEQFRQEISR
jgi:putative glutamine amidotransferase